VLLLGKQNESISKIIPTAIKAVQVGQPISEARHDQFTIAKTMTPRDVAMAPTGTVRDPY